MGAPEAVAAAAALPDWLKVGANVVLFLLSVTILVMGLRKKDHEGGEHGDVGVLLEASPVVRLFTDISSMTTSLASIADNVRLQTDAQRVTSAAAAAIAKTVEDDFKEQRVRNAVEDELRRMAAARDRS